MRLSRLLLAASVVFVLPLASPGDPPGPPVRLSMSPLPAGKWRVEFANGVIESVETRADATAAVTEPARTASGKVTSVAGMILIAFDDDRVERWTSVGRRMVVEHWFPAAQFPNGTPVRGIADSAE